MSAEAGADADGAGPQACVIGWPIAHSRSPLIHNHWLTTLGIRGSYSRERVHPRLISVFLEVLADYGYVGANVTLPHKEQALASATERTDVAVAIGAANTLWIENGRLHADNTDCYGYLADLDARMPGWDNRDRPAVVIGAGGAARAIVYGLTQRVDRVIVANRTRERADDLRAIFGEKIEPVAMHELDSRLGDACLMVNTTSVGMGGGSGLKIDFARTDPACVVSDIVYVPLLTDFLAQAQRHGLRTIDGLGMLLHQAVPGFERWFGTRPQVTPALRRLVERDLQVGVE